jgi:hypothetical protein
MIIEPQFLKNPKIEFKSQIGQDKWVCETLNYKKQGIYVDIGCRGPHWDNNTYYFEKALGWSGISLDIDQNAIDMWKKSDRSLEGLICGNAITVDFSKLFKQYNLPKVIDYLSLDLDPPLISLCALLTLPLDEYKFRTITYETDVFRGAEGGTLNEQNSREYLRSKGYTLMYTVNKQDDFWVYKDLL